MIAPVLYRHGQREADQQLLLHDRFNASNVLYVVWLVEGPKNTVMGDTLGAHSEIGPMRASLNGGKISTCYHLEVRPVLCSAAGSMRLLIQFAVLE